MSLGNRFTALVLVFLPLSVQAADARPLGSTYAVLDALRQNQGDVVLAFIDSPADQSSPLRKIQGLLSVYEVALNGEELGSIRRNSVLYVRPRLGLNRLIIRDAFDASQAVEMSFPAMRSAGAPTSIVEIRTSRQFTRMEAFTLLGREVQAVEGALTRDQTGGMTRVLDLIRSRGKEADRSTAKRMNWGQAVVSTLYEDDSDSEYEDDSDSDSTESISDKDSSEAMASGPGGVAGVDSSLVGPSVPSAETPAESQTEPAESDASVNISADRRSYY